MLSSTLRRRASLNLRLQLLRSQSTLTDAESKPTAIGADGRHEVWRDGIYDHDNEPK